MNTCTYSATNRKTAQLNGVDFITEEPLDILSHDHPRGSINIRYDDGTIKSYNLDTLATLILKGYCDPYTLQSFRKCDIRRTCLYIQSIKEFPKYQLNMLDLYHRFINSYDENLTLEKSQIQKIQLEAKIFIQVTDLVEIFKKYLGNGNLKNRKLAERELKHQPNGSWLIRNCSIIESEYDKPGVVTFKHDLNVYKHILFVHRIGMGFFLIDTNHAIRGMSISDVKLLIDSDQPSIVNLLENIPGLLIKNAYRGNHNSITNIINIKINNNIVNNDISKNNSDSNNQLSID